MNLVVGRVQTHPRGFGFVIPDRPVEGVTGDIFIAGANLNQAIHGDRVVARVERTTGDRAEGRIIRILEHGSSTIVGRFDVDESGMGFLIPFDRRLRPTRVAPGIDLRPRTRGASPLGGYPREQRE